MQARDYISIVVSIISLFFSFASLLFTFFNFRRNATKLKIQQIYMRPDPFGVNARPNILYLDSSQSPDLWTVIPMLHLIIYLKIDNLSYTGITISNFIINDDFLVSTRNTVETGKKLALSFFASKETQEKEFQKYGQATSASNTSFDPDDYNLIDIGKRIDSKSSIEGIIVISGNTDLYNAVKNGKNKLTVVTPDKKIDTYIEIDKTIIPDWSKY